MEVEGLRAFQTASTIDPGIERKIKEQENDSYYRQRSKTFTKSDNPYQGRERSSSFSHLRSPKFQQRLNTGVSELFTAVRDEKKTFPTPAHKTLHKLSASLCGDSPPNFSQFYEILYLGKIKVSHKRAPPTFIDEAVTKINSRPKKSDTPQPELDKENILENKDKENIITDAVAHPLCSPGPPNRTPGPSDCTTPLPAPSDRTLSLCDVVQSVKGKENVRTETSKSVSSTDKDETKQNKIMLFQIGRRDIRLISPDTKQLLVHKSFREISHVSCGEKSKLSFGFICKEVTGNVGGYVGYIFQCDSTSVVEDIMQGLKSAFFTAHENAKAERVDQQCAGCPMVWFNNLCSDLEGLPANKAQSALLSVGEKEGILEKMTGVETTSIPEQNQIMMMLLKAACEIKQGSHQHSGPITDKSATPQPPPQESSITEAAKKAKRSLAESFNGMIRRKSEAQAPVIAVERPTPVKMPHPLSVTNAERRWVHDKSRSPESSLIPVRSPLQPLTPDKHVAFNCELATTPSTPTGVATGGPEVRQRARTVGSAGGETMKRELARKRLARLAAASRIEEEDLKTSPQVSIFKKTGAKSPRHCDVLTSRQHIYNKVTTPVKKKPCIVPKEPRNYRSLWQTAIKQQILLNQLDKENQKRQADEQVLAVKRLKLDYEDLVPVNQDTITEWENILQQGVRVRRSDLRQCIGRGVLKGRRGEIWSLIVAQCGENTPPPTEEFSLKFESWGAEYSTLKGQLTPHQHAILIDLGRTFPSHAYFTGALGPGQLGMFQLLKSYSILDPEVGYCQGLPFLVGLLLMHLDEEEEAFNLLKFVMFNLNLRSMFKPDMTGLQVSMYQLTRLLSETSPALYKLLDRLGVDPSLYATPWLLTLFSAHFPLGFVVRVLDLMLIDGKSAIIKVGMCLLLHASSSLLECDSMEEVMNIFKNDLPSLPRESLEDVITQANSLNVSRQLKVYEVEYSVIQEEMSLNESGKGESYECLLKHNSNLKKEVVELKERISSLEAELKEEREKSGKKKEEETIGHVLREKAETALSSEAEGSRRVTEDNLEAEVTSMKVAENLEAEVSRRVAAETMLTKLMELVRDKKDLPDDISSYLASCRTEEINGNLI